MNGTDRIPGQINNSSEVILETFHALKHAVRFDAPVSKVITDDKKAVLTLCDTLAPDIKESLVFTEVGPEEFTKQSLRQLESHVFATAKRPTYTWEEIKNRKGKIVVLDQPTNPGNVGACIRVAAARGVAGVIVLGEIDPWHPSVVRGAAGLQFALPVLGLQELPELDRPLIALHEVGESLDETTLPENATLVFGSERRGISSNLRARAENTVTIPMQPGVSSLNLATSVAITLYTH